MRPKNFVTSDENGAFVAKLPVGKYKITVNETVSKNFAAFIEVFDNNLNPTDFELIIETSKVLLQSNVERKPDGSYKIFRSEIIHRRQEQ